MGVSENELHQNATRASLPGISEEDMAVYRATAWRVVVFGSLLRKRCFNKWSDVDIAAWGIRPEVTFRAIGAVMDLGEDIEINLVDIDTCRATLRAIIEHEGQEI